MKLDLFLQDKFENWNDVRIRCWLVEKVLEPYKTFLEKMDGHQIFKLQNKKPEDLEVTCNFILSFVSIVLSW
jgi:hypothetical protein